MDSEFMTCEYCGEEDWKYSGEAYDEGEHLGSMWECNECGHMQCDDDPEQDFSMYDEY